MSKHNIYQWELSESNVTQRILRALKHSDAVIIKAAPEDLIDYVITYKNNYFKLHLSREELVNTYSAAKRHNDLADIRVKIMAFILSFAERIDTND